MSFAYQWNRAGTPISGATASAYVPVSADVGDTLTISVTATNGAGPSAPATSAATSAVTAANGWADGYAGAPAGAPQYPALLSSYGSNRPPWHVAGVDYHVGVPDGQVLTDWRTLSSDPKLNVNTSTGEIQFNANYTFTNVDFSLGLGAILYNPSGSGVTQITCIDCNFQLQQGSTFASAGSYIINDQNGATITLRSCHFDGANVVMPPSFIGGNGSIIMEYNWFTNGTVQILECVTTVNNAIITCKYNLYDDMPITAPAHMNYLQNSATGLTLFETVQFNTTFQKSLGGAEGFQFYTNGSGMILNNPQFTNNTMIALPHAPVGPLGPQTMSNMVHGTDSGTTIVGAGQNNNNYFDASGAFFPYYPGTMTAALGWHSSGNIDMNTGAIITEGT
jgi:hypothetical protein